MARIVQAQGQGSTPVPASLAMSGGSRLVAVVAGSASKERIPQLPLRRPGSMQSGLAAPTGPLASAEPTNSARTVSPSNRGPSLSPTPTPRLVKTGPPPHIRDRSPPSLGRAPALPRSFASSIPSYSPSNGPAASAASTTSASVPLVWQPVPMGLGLRWPQVAVTQSLNAARQSPPRQPPAALSAAKAPPQYARLVTPLRQLPHTPRATPFSFQWQPSQSQLQNVASVTSSTISSPALLTPRRVAVSPAPHRPATQEQTQRSPQGPLSYRPAIPAQPAPTERHKEAKGRLDVACPSDGQGEAGPQPTPTFSGRGLAVEAPNSLPATNGEISSGDQSEVPTSQALAWERVTVQRQAHAV